MKIVLAEEQNGVLQPEVAFDSSPIRVGRDAASCRIVFASEQYPMVSRNHAELCWDAGRWVVADLGSSYGTFVDGERVNTAALEFGSLIQFGTDGPKLKVVWFEIDSHYVQSRPAESIAPPAPPEPPKQESPKPSAPHAAAPAASLVLADGSRPPTKIGAGKATMGREAKCTIHIEGAAMVSRNHAEIVYSDGSYVLTDQKSFNGTLLNGHRITSPALLHHEDVITLGVGGPSVKFICPQFPAERPASEEPGSSKTMVANLGNISQHISVDISGRPQLVRQVEFGTQSELTIGRDAACDIVLDGLQISNRHARIVKTASGVSVEDLNSTNGVYINGRRVTKQAVTSEDSIQIGSFAIRVDGAGKIGVFDARSKTRIDAVNISKEVRSNEGGGMFRLLDDISLSIAPNEFVGLLGPSGAGKTTLMDALNGMRPATGGSVLINNLDLYEHLDSIKQSLGYVPQEDIIHRELTVYRTLYYVAKLRLSRDVSRAEIEQIIEEVLDVTGLSERRDVRVGNLSGGQRKRVSIAVELITKPSVIFLDEPTSGLDPSTEEKIMKLFRQIAESGRTVILTTHAMENVRLFDKIVLMMRGKLVFYGTPENALAYAGASSFKELFDRLDAPVRDEVRKGGDQKQVTDRVSEEWKKKFLGTPQYKKYVEEPLREVGKSQSSGVQKKRRLGVFGAIGQFFNLTRRYREVLFRDKMNLAILFAQAPIIALMTFFVMGAGLPRDFVYFTLALVSTWFGTSVAAREIIREKAIYTRERMVNLGLLPYVASKLFMLGVIVGVQCLMFWLPLKFFDLTGLMQMPGSLFGIPQLWTMVLTSLVGVALGLLISALVRTSEMATSLVPLVLIPQILFSGLVGVPQGVSKVVGLAMPAAWSYDSLKRFSGLDTLEQEGAKDGNGLYKRIEEKNDKVISDAKRSVDDGRARLQKRIDILWEDLEAGNPVPPKPGIGDPPVIGDADKLPTDLSTYVTFLHPWMGGFVNQLVLMFMFGMLVLATLVVLRLKDIV